MFHRDLITKSCPKNTCENTTYKNNSSVKLKISVAQIVIIQWKKSWGPNWAVTKIERIIIIISVIQSG